MASNKYLEILPETELQHAPAQGYANLGDQAVLRELAVRHIPYQRAEPPSGGVRLPIKLTGRLHGVLIRSTLPPKQARKTPFDIMDGRLALALDDFCRILQAHDIVEVVHFTIYRASGVSNPDAPQYRHGGGLAIDVGALRKRSGRWMTVGPHWAPQIGAQTCGPGARKLRGRPGRELLSIVCEAYEQKLFHYSLTPHFDASHHDHLHLEIKPGVKWFLVN
ncbi:extensin family protein [Myxococcota bacterium]